MKNTGLLIIILLIYSCGQQTGDKIWPQFRGINSSGVSAENASAPVKFEDNNLDWKTDLVSGVSSPVIWEKKIFLTGYIEDNKELQTICINRKNGKILWQSSVFPDTIEKHHSISSPAQSTVVTDGERIISYFGSCGLICYDMMGNMQWKYSIPCNRAQYGSATSPVIAEDKLILIYDIGRTRYLLALDKFTGIELWKTGFQTFNLPNLGGDATPVIHNDIIVVHRVGELAGYSVSDGSQIWRYRLLTQGSSTPIVADNNIVAACWSNSTEEDQRAQLPDFSELLQAHDLDKNRKISRSEFPSDLILYARPEIMDLESSTNYVRWYFSSIDKNRDREIEQQEWVTSIDSIKNTYYKEAGLIAVNSDSKGPLADSLIIWRVPESVPEVPSPIFYQGRIYMIKDGGIITCVDPETGRVVYKTRLGNPGSYLASPVAANGNLYIFGYNGKLKIIKAGDEFNIVAEHDFKDNIGATPAIVGNSIYIRTRNALLSYSDH
jgi:outer membrane protein assembly factor BamB